MSSGFSQLILYKDSKIEIGKNFIVDSISDYLKTLDKVSIPLFQFIKHQLSLTIKVAMNQHGIEATSSYNFNYCSIQNASVEDDPLYSWTGKTYYYHIVKREWASQEAIKLYLVLDTLNTFKSGVDFNFNAKTRVHRQHKDRFNSTPTNYEEGMTIEGTTEYDSLTSTYRFEHTYNFPYGAIINISQQDTPTPAGLTVSITNTTTTYKIVATYTDSVNFSIPLVFRYSGYSKIMDQYSEGISPIQFKYEDEYIQDKTLTSWNLMYKNNDTIDPDKFNQINPIDVFLFPDDPLTIKIRTSNLSLSKTDFAYGDFIFAPNNNDVSRDSNTNITLITTSGNYVIKTQTTFQYTPLIMMSGGSWVEDYKEEFAVKVTKLTSGGQDKLQLTYIRRYTKYNTFLNSWKKPVDTIIAVSGLLDSFEIVGDHTKFYYSATSDWSTKSSSFNNVSSSTAYLGCIEDVDKTDSKIVKIIKIPYCPTNISLGSGVYSFGTNWTYDNTTGFLKLNNLNTSFINYIETETTPLEPLKTTYLSKSLTESRSIKDPKIYHSDFYTPKYVYDSFSYGIQLENIDITNLRNFAPFKFNYVVSNTVNSRFLFDFNELNYKRAIMDYPTVMNVARNNEVTAYTNQFINYLRTGYNYDVKSKERQDTASYIGLGTSLVGSIASLGLGLASGNPAVAISSVIGATGSITNTIVGTINSLAQREANLEQKMVQLKAQATSVSGADDLDLMMYYAKNRLKYGVYRCSNLMWDLIDDLFYYSGYATDEMGAPNLTSRKWFNFASCDLVMDTNVAISDECEADLISKYAEGVTVLHKQVISGANTWDFEQTHENWEVSLL